MTLINEIKEFLTSFLDGIIYDVSNNINNVNGSYYHVNNGKIWVYRKFIKEHRYIDGLEKYEDFFDIKPSYYCNNLDALKQYATYDIHNLSTFLCENNDKNRDENNENETLIECLINNLTYR